MTIETVRLGKLVRITGGGTPDRKNPSFWGGEISWASVKDLADLELGKTKETITREGLEHSAAKLLPAGSIVVATRMAVGRCTITTIPVAINQDLKALEPSPELDPRYLLWFLVRTGPLLERQAKGATVKGIKLESLEQMKIPLPPLPEQRRIAAILDKADAVRRKRQQTLDLADQFLRSAFLDMFGDPVTNPKGWPIVPMEDLAEPSKGSIVIGPFGSDLKVCDYRTEGHPIIFVRDILEGQFTWKSNTYVDGAKFIQLSSHRVLGGDVVATKMGTPPGIAAVYPSQMPEGVVTADIIRIRPDLSKTYPTYLASAINASYIKAQVRRITEGVTRPKITLRRFKELRIPHPPLELQEAWDKLVVVRETNAGRAISLSTRCDALFGGLLQRAFRGTLSAYLECQP